ncbi:conserved hypothetical protein [Ricinus communis]|uniref:Uncharacterized protein n=1 Tax=Ricinus communis TaxID=3988 RepID=B9TFA8_RICCO|nr:conserved hypothetical protein [Ricinus communis]
MADIAGVQHREQEGEGEDRQPVQRHARAAPARRQDQQHQHQHDRPDILPGQADRVADRRGGAVQVHHEVEGIVAPEAEAGAGEMAGGEHEAQHPRQHQHRQPEGPEDLDGGRPEAVALPQHEGRPADQGDGREDHGELREGAEEEAEREGGRAAIAEVARQPAIDEQDRDQHRQRHAGIAACFRSHRHQHRREGEEQGGHHHGGAAARLGDLRGDQDRRAAAQDREQADQRRPGAEADHLHPERVDMVVIVVIDADEHADRRQRIARLRRGPGLVEPQVAQRTDEAQRQARKSDRADRPPPAPIRAQIPPGHAPLDALPLRSRQAQRDA